MEHHRTVLDNGLRVVQVPMPAMHSVSLVVFVGVGSRFESERDAGVCHLIEHMLFKGTHRRPSARDISETLESVGGILNGSTDKELTVYWAKVAAEHFPLALDLLVDMLRNSRITPADINKEKNIILEELHMIADDPQEWVHVLTEEVLWADQPMGREVAGTRESVTELKRRDVRRFLDLFYGPNNVALSVAGGIDPAKTLDHIQRQLNDWTPVDRPEPPAASVSENGNRFRFESKAAEQVNVCLAFPGIPRDHPDRWALDVLCTILGGSTSSRLFVQLRERLGLAYDVHAYTTHVSDTGSIVIYAGMEAGKTERVLSAIYREMDKLRRRRIGSTELRRAKQSFRGRLWLGLEDTHSVAGWFGAQEILHRDVVTPEEAVHEVEQVTESDLLRVARAYFQPEHARLAAVGPVADPALVSNLARA